MRFGKLTGDELEKLILSKTSAERREVVLSGAMGEDCAALDIKEYTVLSTDPITADMPPFEMGMLSVDVAVNDVFSCGAEPVALMCTIIVPPDCDAHLIGVIMDGIHCNSKKLNVDIIGGHTEFSDCVTRPIVSVTAIGKATRIVKKADIRPGDGIYMTKSAGLEGAYILGERISDRLDANEKAALENIKNSLSISREAKLLSKCVGVTSMHDATEGGVLGASAEIILGTGLGAEIYYDSIPVDELVIKISMLCGVDPLRLLSSGSLIFTGQNLNGALSCLEKAGIGYAKIGVVNTGDRVELIKSDGSKESVEPRPDELFTRE